jgi:hypothetical protein
VTKIRQDFEIWTGEDKVLQYTITNETGASVNLAGYTAHWLLQDEYNSGSLLRLKTGGSGVVVSGCTATVTVSGSDTAGCALSGLYYTELTACDTSRLMSVLAIGEATINRRGY